MYIASENSIWLSKGEEKVYLLPKMANRHGLIAGATGTGKTITLKVLAESFSDMGVPVFLADIKGDVSGLCMPGQSNKNVDQRIQQLGVTEFSYKAYPVRFFDVFGKKGIPVRTTISDMGPELLARIMELNDTQASVLQVIFKIADDQGLLLLDTKDLSSMLAYVAENKDQYQTTYGNIAPQTIGTIQRSVVTLDTIGGNIFFGEPALDITDWIAQDDSGRGIINLLYCAELINSPVLYSTFLLWMLSELYELLPEVGDLDKPKMVFFFDEAHLLFANAPKVLLQKVEQVARLIRSKGVGIYFITQSPADVPDTVLAQLGNKIQHALRAYTPNDRKAVKAAAASYRSNPAFNSETVLSELGTGEALLSLLNEKGAPGMVQRAFILPPQSFMGVADESIMQQRIKGNYLYAKYATVADNESAHEILQQKMKESQESALQKEQEEIAAQQAEKEAKRQQKLEEKQQQARGRQMKSVERVITNTVSSVGRELGRSIIRGLFNTIKR